jgi:hypothetical protein
MPLEKFSSSTAEQRLDHNNNAAVQMLFDLPMVVGVWAEKKENMRSS